MAKFKVGDKVRVVRDWKLTNGSTFIDKTATITMDDGTGCYPYRIDIDGGNNPWEDGELELVKQPVREFIVLRRDGAKIIAELRHDREIIKSAVATCSEKDTFDFDTGAKIAFDRLMGREEPAPAPEPPKFYTGKVVCISGEYGVGRIFTVKDGFFADRQYNCPEKPYKSVDDMNDRFLFGKFAEAKE